MAQRQRAQLSSVIHCPDIPFTISVIILSQCAIAFTCHIHAIGIRYKIYLSSTSQDALVQLNILISCQSLVKHSILLETFSLPTPERNRIRFNNFVNAQPECCISHSEPIAQYFLDCKRLWGFIKDISTTSGTDIICMQFIKRTHQYTEIIRSIRGMGVQTHDYFAF